MQFRIFFNLKILGGGEKEKEQEKEEEKMVEEKERKEKEKNLSKILQKAGNEVEYCATKRKVVGSIADYVNGIFH